MVGFSQKRYQQGNYEVKNTMRQSLILAIFISNGGDCETVERLYQAQGKHIGGKVITAHEIAQTLEEMVRDGKLKSFHDTSTRNTFYSLPGFTTGRYKT